MFQYADPRRCPVCRAEVPYAAIRCDACASTLTGTAAEQLFRTLTHADRLVAQVSAAAAPTPAAPVATGTAPAVAPAAPALPPDYPAFPVPQQRPPHPGQQPRPVGTGLTSASIPRILLGLGATCLMVAALVFLAVAWAVLGVSGRTVALVLLTGVAGASAGWLVHKGLRGGAEALAAVTAGLITLDLFGAGAAGWLSLDGGGFLVALGSALAVPGLAAGAIVRHARRQDVRRLVAAEVVGGAGVLLAGLGGIVAEAFGGSTPSLLAATVLAIVVALASYRVGLEYAASTLTTGALLLWSSLVLGGLARFDGSPTVAEVWGGFAVWPLVAAAALALVPAALPFLTTGIRVVFTAAAAALGSLVATLPALDESATEQTIVQLAVVALAVAAGVRVARPWRWTVAAPALVAGLGLFVGVAARVGDALEVLLDHDVWASRVGTDLAAVPLPWHLPLLLPAAALGALLAGWVGLRMRSEAGLRRLLAPFGMVAVATTALLPALYGAPLALAVLVLLVASLAALVTGVRGRGLLVRVTGHVLATLLGSLTLAAATASDVLTATTTGVAALVALLAAYARSSEARGLGDFCFPPAVAAFAWTVLHLVDVPETWRAVLVMLVLGAWLLTRPAVAREISLAATATVVVVLGTTSPAGVDQTWLAVDLTLAGALVTLSALVHPSRRVLGWVGLGLLTLAQWTRLGEVGVTTVEAYTLPLALVLLTVGVVRMLRSTADSATALGPGLVLALAPTTAIVLVDPLSARAVLLGAACLVAVAAGGALRWSAPLVAGAGFGLLLVLREAIAAQVLPQWIMIGLVGLVLTLVGVTWERRLAELRMATHYVRRLR